MIPVQRLQPERFANSVAFIIGADPRCRMILSGNNWPVMRRGPTCPPSIELTMREKFAALSTQVQRLCKDTVAPSMEELPVWFEEEFYRQRVISIDRLYEGISPVRPQKMTLPARELGLSSNETRAYQLSVRSANLRLHWEPSRLKSTGARIEAECIVELIPEKDVSDASTNPTETGKETGGTAKIHSEDPTEAVWSNEYTCVWHTNMWFAEIMSFAEQYRRERSNNTEDGHVPSRTTSQGTTSNIPPAVSLTAASIADSIPPIQDNLPSGHQSYQ
jgi:hypothetical protein